MNPAQLPGRALPGGDPGPGSEREDRLRFMRRLVHDLNNSLSIITIDMGLMRTDGGFPAPDEELLKEIADAALKASRLTGLIGRCLNELVESLPGD